MLTRAPDPAPAAISLGGFHLASGIFRPSISF
jgi:hypothetical protein